MATPLLQRDPNANNQPGGLFPWDQGLGVSIPSSLPQPLNTKTPPTPVALPASKATAAGVQLPSSTSIPLPGQDSLPDSFDELKTQIGLTPPKKDSLLKTAVKGIGDIVLQPARALEQLGKFIGTLGLSEEQKKKVDEYLGPGAQERALGSGYSTPTPKTGKEAGGIALQAGANLSVPFATSLPAMAAGGAAYAGGKALEEGKSAGAATFDALLGGAGSAALGSLLNVGGSVIGRGFRAAAPEILKTFKPIIDKIGPAFTGTSRKEFDTVFKDSPHVLLDYLNTIKGSGSPGEAEGLLQGRLLENVKTVMGKAKEVEGTAFSDASKLFNDSFPDVKVDIDAVGNRLLEKMPRFGLPRNADEQFALNQVQKIIQEPREYTVDGARTLLQDLFAFADGLDSGSPAEKLAMEAWADVRQELAKATTAVDGGAFEAAMARYSNFKDQATQLKQVNNANEDTARSFVRNLAGTNKTASRESLEALAEMAGIDDAMNSIEVYRLMKKLILDGKITGSRVADIGLATAAPLALGTIGSMFGPGGEKVGYTLGTLLTIKALAPSTITSVMLSELKAAGIPVTSEIRKALEEAIKNPAVRQAIINETVNSVNEKEPLK
jgi:hypothetical protein